MGDILIFWKHRRQPEQDYSSLDIVLKNEHFITWFYKIELIEKITGGFIKVAIFKSQLSSTIQMIHPFLFWKSSQKHES